jgi:thymidylate synthase
LEEDDKYGNAIRVYSKQKLSKTLNPCILYAIFYVELNQKLSCTVVMKNKDVNIAKLMYLLEQLRVNFREISQK